MEINVHGTNSKDGCQTQLLASVHLQFDQSRDRQCKKQHISRDADDGLSNVDTATVDAYCCCKKLRIPAPGNRLAGEQQGEEDGNIGTQADEESEPDGGLEDLVRVQASVEER